MSLVAQTVLLVIVHPRLEDHGCLNFSSANLRALFHRVWAITGHCCGGRAFYLQELRAEFPVCFESSASKRSLLGCGWPGGCGPKYAITTCCIAQRRALKGSSARRITIATKLCEDLPVPIPVNTHFKPRNPLLKRSQRRSPRSQRRSRCA